MSATWNILLGLFAYCRIVWRTDIKIDTHLLFIPASSYVSFAILSNECTSLA